MWSKERINLDEYETKVKLLWWQEQGLSYTVSGYGTKIPTSRMVLLGNRWHRIYVSCYSNTGIAYIIRKGERVIVH